MFQIYYGRKMEVLKSQRGTLMRETQIRWQSDNTRRSTFFALALLSIRSKYVYVFIINFPFYLCILL